MFLEKTPLLLLHILICFSVYLAVDICFKKMMEREEKKGSIEDLKV